MLSLKEDILEVIRLLFEVIDSTTSNEISGSIFIADIFKTFDSLNWDFMFRVVLKYCFGSTIAQWLKTFTQYTIPSSNFIAIE